VTVVLLAAWVLALLLYVLVLLAVAVALG